MTLIHCFVGIVPNTYLFIILESSRYYWALVTVPSNTIILKCLANDILNLLRMIVHFQILTQLVYHFVMYLKW